MWPLIGSRRPAAAILCALILVVQTGSTVIGFQEVGPVPVNNAVLTGMYSGELHGFVDGGVKYAAVLVVGFDGLGGITGGMFVGRANTFFKTNIMSTDTVGPVTSAYAVNADGSGTMYLQNSSDLGTEKFAIAVADGGKVVKVILHGYAVFNMSRTPGATSTKKTIIGDLVKQ